MKERKLSIREIIVLLIAVILLISATACRASKADQTKENKKATILIFCHIFIKY